MTAEAIKKEFLKDYTAYFTEQELRPVDEKRLLSMVDDAISKIKPVSKVKVKHVVKRVYLKPAYASYKMRASGLMTMTNAKAEQILKQVAKDHGITVEQIKSNRHHMHLVSARIDFTKRVFEESPITPYKFIGQILGGRDHSTIVNYKKSIIENTR
jgi:chromosomal replication initiation ATPase DnaA